MREEPKDQDRDSVMVKWAADQIRNFGSEVANSDREVEAVTQSVVIGLKKLTEAEKLRKVCLKALGVAEDLRGMFKKFMEIYFSLLLPDSDGDSLLVSGLNLKQFTANGTSLANTLRQRGAELLAEADDFSSTFVFDVDFVHETLRRESLDCEGLDLAIEVAKNLVIEVRKIRLKWAELFMQDVEMVLVSLIGQTEFTCHALVNKKSGDIEVNLCITGEIVDTDETRGMTRDEKLDWVERQPPLQNSRWNPGEKSQITTKVNLLK